MNRYTLAAAKLGSTVIDQITDQDINFGIEELIAGGDGDVDPRIVGVAKMEPVLGFTSTALGKVLTVTGSAGVSIAAGFELYFAKLLSGGSRGGAATGIKLAASLGIMIPKTVKASQGKEGSIDCSIYAVSSNGTTCPLTLSTGVTIPTPSTTPQLFTAGGFVLNGGTAIDSVQDQSVDFGLTVEFSFGSGAVYPIFAGVSRRKAKATVKLADASALSTFVTGGVPVGIALNPATTTSITFLGVAAGGLRSGSNVVVRIYNGRAFIDKLSGGDGEEQAADVTITPVKDSSGNFFALTVP